MHNLHSCLIADSVPAFFDVWFLGDGFLKDIFQKFLDIEQEAMKSTEVQKPFILNYYNVHDVHRENASEGLMSTRILNALMEALNVRNCRLPKYLIVILDKDIICDVKDLRAPEAPMVLSHLMAWVTKQVHTIIRRKRIALLDAKPGVVSGTT